MEETEEEYWSRLKKDTENLDQRFPLRPKTGRILEKPNVVTRGFPPFNFKKLSLHRILCFLSLHRWSSYECELGFEIKTCKWCDRCEWIALEHNKQTKCHRYILRK